MPWEQTGSKEFLSLLWPLFLPLHSKQDMQLGFLNQATYGPDAPLTCRRNQPSDANTLICILKYPQLPTARGRWSDHPLGTFSLTALISWL